MILSVKQVNCDKCPLWGVAVSVIGLYTQAPDGSWKFNRAECPIVKNAKLPVYQQDSAYKYMRCDDPRACPLYTQFHPSITSDK